MLLFTIFYSLNINLYSNKELYLKGESILVYWELVNTGSTEGYYVPHGNLKVLDVKGNIIPHLAVKRAVVTKGSGKVN